jgi:hypothetical protein
MLLLDQQLQRDDKYMTIQELIQADASASPNLVRVTSDREERIVGQIGEVVEINSQAHNVLVRYTGLSEQPGQPEGWLFLDFRPEELTLVV